MAPASPASRESMAAVSASNRSEAYPPRSTWRRISKALRRAGLMLISKGVNRRGDTLKPQVDLALGPVMRRVNQHIHEHFAAIQLRRRTSVEIQDEFGPL